MTPDFVAAARGWIGTPYVHQASARGAGCDCLGLLRGVWRDCLGAEPEAVPPYSPDWSEVQHDERLWRAARRWLVERPVTEVEPGDVLLFRMQSRAVAKHLGILAGPHSFIHAFSGHGVIESALALPWQRRVVACFAFPKGFL